MVFEKKKIQLETLSEYLAEVRNHLQLSLKEVSQKTAIKQKFLENLESGDFSGLPPDVYVLGFLRQLAAIYLIDAEVLAEQYKKEKAIQQQLRLRKGSQIGWRPNYFKNLVITPKLMSLAAGILFVTISILYIIWQVLSINRTPSLTILQPQDGQLVQGTFVNIIGKTDAGTNVTVNGQSIFVDDQGNFKSQMALQNGSEELDVVASNRFGKSAGKTLSVVGQSSSAQPTGQVRLKLDFSADVSLAFSVDDGQPQTVAFHSGDSKTIIGQQKIVISTSDAGATKLTLNDKVVGLLGRPKENLQNVPFYAEPKAPSSTPQ